MASAKIRKDCIIYSRDNIVPILQRCVALKIVVQCVVGSASCVAPTMLEELCTFLRYASAIKEQKKCWESWLKSLTGLKCCATILNYKQQHAIGWANGNPTMLHPFARGSGGVRATIAMHCGFKIFKMAAKVEKFRRLYALFFNRYSSFLRSFFSIS